MEEALSIWRARAGRWLREPLLHFLLLGALFFVSYGWLAPVDKESRHIVVTNALEEALAHQYKATWMRPPTEQELSGLVEAYVRSEILYREGLALGLDSDDTVIKRRVRQKMEVMAEEQLARATPSDAELSAYLAKNATHFSQPSVLSFEQILFENTGNVAQTQQALANARAALARGAAADTLGQLTMLPHNQNQVSLDLVARDFGNDFAEQLVQLPVGEWVGPITSSFGVHLVRVTGRAAAVLPPLEAVRQQVAREWENAQREHSRDESYQQLRSHYEVTIEPKSAKATTQP